MITAGIHVTDPDGDVVTIKILGITQNEPLGNTSPDAIILEDGLWKFLPGRTVNRNERLFEVRAETQNDGKGRIYQVAFEATDGEDSCTGEVSICVPYDGGDSTCVDDGGDFIDSTAVAEITPSITTTAFSLRGRHRGGVP
jgi:hypothetical protein